VQVADALAERHQARVIVLGSKQELPRAEALAAQMRVEPIILAGKTTLAQAAGVLERCSLAIGGDTGLIHYSFALGTPLVCLVGASPLRNGPKGEKAITVASACAHRPCRPDGRCKRGEGRPCMLEITVEQVLEAAEKLLSGTPST
jgi:ADP-heptose:LPS heptosyltransferase